MITLREYIESDTEGLVQLANNKNVSMHLVDTFPFPCILEDAIWWIKTGSKEKGASTKVIESSPILRKGEPFLMSHKISCTKHYEQKIKALLYIDSIKNTWKYF